MKSKKFAIIPSQKIMDNWYLRTHSAKHLLNSNDNQLSSSNISNHLFYMYNAAQYIYDSDR